MGTTGTSGDISRDQAATFLIEKDFVLSPLPEAERFGNLINMKEWQCGVFHIADAKGEPYVDPLPYVLLFNHMVGIHHWACTGETNKDGIFHVHALLKTGMRTDSCRRSLITCFNNLLSTSAYRDVLGTRQATFDCLKLQKCHKPSSLMAYMMKGPQWLISNDERMLQYGYDITLYGLNERFKPKPDTEPVVETAPDMNEMTKNIVDLIITNGCKTFDDCLRTGPELMSKYLHRPGLKAIIDNCLSFVKATGGTWSLALYEAYDPDPSTIHKILLHQGIKPSEFDPAFHAWITKTDSKRNCICIEGPSNTGKSAFIAGLKQCINWGEIVNGNSGFNFEALLDANIGCWEEPLCSPELAEKVKQILEGMVTSIPVKYKKPQTLPRTPIIITTNHPLWRFCSSEEEMFRNRMWIFSFRYNSKDDFYTPRTSEHSCECPYCRASSSRSFTHGESSASRMQGTDESISTREQSTGTIASSDVGSGSMCTGGGSSEGSYDRTHSSTTSSTDLECPSSSGIHSSAGSANVGHVGSFRIIRSDNPKCRSTSTTERVESHGNIGRDGGNSSRHGFRKRRDRGGNGDSIQEHGSTDILVSESSNQKEKKIPVSTKKRRVDRTMASRVGKIKLPMFVPLKQDWQEYLSYLYHWYG